MLSTSVTCWTCYCLCSGLAETQFSQFIPCTIGNLFFVIIRNEIGLFSLSIGFGVFQYLLVNCFQLFDGFLLNREKHITYSRFLIPCTRHVKCLPCQTANLDGDFVKHFKRCAFANEKLLGVLVLLG